MGSILARVIEGHNGTKIAIGELVWFHAWSVIDEETSLSILYEVEMLVYVMHA